MIARIAIAAGLLAALTTASISSNMLLFGIGGFGAPAGGGGCVGAVDLSKGCPLPMLGVF